MQPGQECIWDNCASRKQHGATNWRQSAPCRCMRSSITTHAVQQGQQHRMHPAGNNHDHAGAGSTLDRRKTAYTYRPQVHQHFRKTQQQPDPHRNSSTGKQVRQRQQQYWHQQQAQQLHIQPDPAADDLDALATQAVSGLTAHSDGSSWSADGLPVPSLINVVPDSKPTAVTAASVPPGRKPRYAVSSKLHLTAEAAKDIARRLRRAGPPTPGQPVIRIFRYGVDDLRLFKALDMAGLEGRVVVVDTVQFADAVITTRNKRTGKAVNLAVARRTADAAGVPYIQLRAVSAQRLLEALGPMLGLKPNGDEAATDAQPSHEHELPSAWTANAAAREAVQQQDGVSDFGRIVNSSNGLRSQPRLLRWEEVDGDGGDELLQLLWGPTAAAGTVAIVENADSGSSTTSCSSPACAGAAVVGDVTPRWLAWRAAQDRLCSAATAWELIRDADVEDSRDGMVPANPTQRAGEKYKLKKPLRHGSRLRRKRLLRYLRLKQVPW